MRCASCMNTININEDYKVCSECKRTFHVNHIPCPAHPTSTMILKNHQSSGASQNVIYVAPPPINNNRVPPQISTQVTGQQRTPLKGFLWVIISIAILIIIVVVVKNSGINTQAANDLSNQYTSSNTLPNTEGNNNLASNDSSTNNLPPTEIINPTPFVARGVYYPFSDPDCAGSKLKVGDRAMISLGGGRNSIRNTADTHPSDNIIGHAYPGDYLEIIDGPVCNYGWILWKVRLEKDGLTGWTPETKDGIEFWIIQVE